MVVSILVRAYLHLRGEAGLPDRMEIATYPFVVGRHPHCDGRLDVPSVSQKHARIDRDGEAWVLEDLESTNGTRVARTRIAGRHVLREGDVVEFGAVRAVFSTSPEPPAEPPPSPPRRRVPVAVLGAAAGVLASVLAAAGFLILTRAEDRPPSPSGGPVAPAIDEPTAPIEREVAPPSVAEEIAAAEREIAAHRPDLARGRLEAVRARAQAGAEERRIGELLARAGILEPAYAALRTALAGTQTNWDSLGPADVLRLFASTGVERTQPLAVAAVALLAGDEDVARRLFEAHLAADPGSVERVKEVYVLFTGREPPPTGPREIEDSVPVEPGPRPDAKKEELERLQSELARLQALEEARSAAREGFERYVASIDIYILNLDYDRAIRDLEALAADLRPLGLDDLVAVVEARLFDARGARALLRRLLHDVNAGTLVRHPSWQTASRVYDDVRLLDADAEGVRVVLPQAEIQLRWRVLDAARLVGFFELLKLSIEERYFLGKICLDRGLESAAHHQWIQVVRNGPPELRRGIDRNLAERLGAPVPEGGFVIHGNELVHPEVKANLEKGLVLFRGQWMTKEELAKARAGMVQYRGEWISREEKAALESLEREASELARTEGFVRENGRWVYRHSKEIDGQLYLSVGGKFYAADKAREMRSEWANAWTLTTEHFDLRTNMPDDFATEWADFMEAAWRAYIDYFGVEIENRLELFAFRTYDDYRNYCQETGNVGNLKAGGFADPALGRGVGWKSGRDMGSLFFTMIHEGAHLYHFYAFKTPVVPSWYAEGTATQFEGYQWDSGARTLTVDYVSRSRLAPVKGDVLAGRAMQLADFVRANAPESINEGPAKAAAFYATAWAFKNFLDHSTDPVVRRMADEFSLEMEGGEFRALKLVGVPAPGDSPLERVFGADLAWLQARFEDYVKGIK
ncbi:MAG: FHA domain-containing protein [Planctomycetes bacterium]|nr:FHA domain-containing protein [Planctomycetota bacterium]